MKIIGLGCSVSLFPGWLNFLAQYLNAEQDNLSQGSGSNTLQIKRFQEHVLNCGLTNKDVVIWQVTGTARAFYRTPGTKENLVFAKKDSEGRQWDSYTVSRHDNLFDGMKRIDFLSHSRFAISLYGRQQCPFEWTDEPQILEDLLFTLIAAKKLTPNVIVFSGWDDAIKPEYLPTFIDQLEKNNIDYINEPMVDWCKSKNLGFSDDTHPDSDATASYGKEIILPKLQKLLSENNE